MTDTTGATDSDGDTGPGGLWLLSAVALGTMLAPLNSTMIAVALPQVMREFRAELGLAGWLVTGYLVAMATLQPIAGKLGDQLGRRRLILGALGLFGVASLGAALAPSLELLLICRLGQGVCGAVIVPNGTALLREVVPAAERGARFGLLGGAIALAAAVGPPLGGLLDESFGWRAIFWANVPLVVGALLLGGRSIPVTRRPILAARQWLRGFDFLGAALLLATLLTTARLLIGRGTLIEGLPAALGVALAGVLWAALIGHGWRRADAILQPRLFQHRAFAAANAGIGLSNLAMYTTLLALPQQLATRPGWSSASTGLALTAMSATMVICTPIGGRLADRLGRRVPTVAGLTLLTLGVAPLWRLGADISLVELVVTLGAAGVGLGLSSAGLQTSALESVGPEHAGIASGLFSTSRYLGSIIGSSLLAALVGAGDGATAAFTTVFLVVVVAAGLATLASLGLAPPPGAGATDQDC